MMEYIGPAMGLLFTFENILWANLGVFIGAIFSAIPGLTVMLCITLFLPITYTMGPIPGMMFLLGIYCAGGYGGSVSAILINTPGTPHAAATMLDGHPLAQKGRAKAALRIALEASTFGGIFSALALLFLGPQVAKFAAQLGTPEYFLVCLFGLTIISGVSGKKRADKMEIDLDDPQVGEIIGERRHQQLQEDVELLGAGREFDMEAVRNGTLSPVFFGSALTNFGVEPFLEDFLRMTTAPLPRTADCGEIDIYSEDFSAFVFKIQANMNKAHRDRLAFMRICSGKFERDREVYFVQGNKKMRLSQPQQMMAQEREIVDEAYAGDIIGVFDPGIFSIGDTISMPGKKFKFAGIPTFAPEHFCRVSPRDTMKRKQFIKGTEQIAQEGAIQIFKVPNTGMEEVIVGVVGTLQFDVFEHRMKNEYGVDLRMEGLPYEQLRFIQSAPCPLDELNLSSDAELLEDYRGHSLLVFTSPWSVDFTLRKNPGLELSETING